MLSSVKNKNQRSGLIALLTFIVQGTQSQFGHAFVPQEEGEKLFKAEPTFVVLDKTVKNAEGQIKATATQVAIDALTLHAAGENSNVVEPTTTSTPEPMKFDFVKLDAVPQINRGGNKSESYPFESLKAFPAEPHAFFVPVSEARPNPAKSLASTVASATKRHATTDKAVYTVRKRMDQDGKLLGAFVIRTA